MTSKMALAGLQKSVVNRPSSVEWKIGVREHGGGWGVEMWRMREIADPWK